MRLLTLVTAGLMALSTFASSLPDWVASNTKKAALAQIDSQFSDYLIKEIESYEVELDPPYLANQTDITFTTGLSATLTESATCNPVKNKLLCRYVLKTQNGEILSQGEGIFFRAE